MAGAAETIARFAAGLELDSIPAEVRESAKLHLLDTIGCGLAASALDVGSYAPSAVAERGAGGRASAISIAAGVPPEDAALVNGTLCHALDFDDTHSGSVSHISVAVAPATIATAEEAGTDGAELLTALVVGNEVATRVGMAAAGDFHARGFHPTAVCGIFGAVAAAARMAGLDERQIGHALGIDGSMASGILAYLSDGSETKRIHPGWAGHGAVMATRLAAHGATGPAGVFEGRFGLYATFLGRNDVDLGAQLADLGTRWETPRIAFKPFPACHYLHASLDAAAAAIADGGVRVEEIEEIVALSPPAGVPMVLEPLDAKLRPRSEYEAKFSLPYSVAAMLVRGTVDVMSYSDEAIADPEVLDLARRVRYEVRDYPTYPKAFPGGVRIVTRDGRSVERELHHQRGGPEYPMTPEQVRDKFQANAQLALPDAAPALEGELLRLERCADLGAFETLRNARNSQPRPSPDADE